MAGGATDLIGSAIDRHAGRSAFGRNAATYDTARSGYPPALLGHIAGHCAANPAIFEIGAGTGLATDLLLGLEPRRLTVLEPDPGMAAVLATRLDGTSAEIVCAPFPDRSVTGPFDLVACAAAFHWLETGPTLAHIVQLLSGNGILAVWWNSYFGHGHPDPFGERMTALIEREGVALPPSYVGGRHYAFDAELQRQTFASGGFATIDQAIFVTKRRFTPRQARDLFATFSFVELLPEDRRQRLLGEISRIVADEFAGAAEGVCATANYLCKPV
jgi:SAM-dependent methyltransferase